MATEKRVREHKCHTCGKVFTSRMRLGHHTAAEHAPKTSQDIITTRDIPRQPQIIPSNRV